jgi:hypothetical protein
VLIPLSKDLFMLVLLGKDLFVLVLPSEDNSLSSCNIVCKDREH